MGDKVFVLRGPGGEAIVDGETAAELRKKGADVQEYVVADRDTVFRALLADVLASFAEREPRTHEYGFPWYFYRIRAVGLPDEASRAVLRTLRNMGFMRYERGLWNEDGTMAGAGYGLTERGYEAGVRLLAGADPSEVIPWPPREGDNDA